ncbi:apolipoprotein N-acyltransferase [Thermodesulfobacterium hydrogeniphilum]|uniref:apolipoprotein N-acyltransferase n=1 Tax=Thermodesulfobacterium hydrogeniphilum TaxID=161156 RepID=UPI000570868D|nr:apolipoprotein N-acyltransferase [Thermodesulfobacterium hydrogeniphilum]
MSKKFFNWYNISFTILSALLLTLAFPKWNLYLLSLCALVPLFLVFSYTKNPKEVIFLSFLFGIGHFSTLLYWIVYTLVKYGHIFFIASFFLLLLLSSYLALYFILLFYTTFKIKIFEKPNFIKGLFLALSFSGTEYLRSKLLTGFPWGQLGYLLSNFSLLLQSADIWGVWGLTLIVVFINYYFYFLINIFFIEKNLKKFFSFNNFLFIFFISLFSIYGIISKNNWENKILHKKQCLKVALLQGNVPQEIKEAKEIAYSLKIYRKLSFSAIKEKPDLILLPETAFPFYFPYEKEPTFYLLSYLDNLKKESQKLGKIPKIIFGTFRLSYTQGKPKVYNSLIVWDGENFVDLYDKEHLVPFGEYIPLGNYFSFLKHISVVSDIIKPGFSKNLTVPLSSGFIKITPLICFESAFSKILQKRAKENTQLIYIATNDAWFDKTSAPYQHFQMAVIRAVEARRYTLQVANTGITGIIDPTGKVLKQTQLEKEAILFGEVKPFYKKTLFVNYGNILGILGSLILVGSFLIVLFRI